MSIPSNPYPKLLFVGYNPTQVSDEMAKNHLLTGKFVECRHDPYKRPYPDNPPSPTRIVTGTKDQNICAKFWHQMSTELYLMQQRQDVKHLDDAKNQTEKTTVWRISPEDPDLSIYDHVKKFFWP